MKIFINARFLTQPLSGVQRYAIECSRQIKKLYPLVTFVAPKNILHKDIAKELNVKIIGFNIGHFWEQIDLPLYLAKQHYPPLLNLANSAPLFYSNNFVTIHDLAFYHHPEWNTKLFAAWYNMMVPRLAKKSRQIFTVSNTILNEIIHCYNIPSAKITVTYNGISQKMLSADSLLRPAKEKIILSVGTFNIRKNHQNLVAAYLDSAIKDEYQLVIVGDKNKVFRDGMLDENAIKNSNIKILETINEDELISMYQKAKIVASLSVYEGFGIPLLEGLYNGCKVICSDIPVYHELYDDYAFFCNPFDVKDISRALDIVVTEPVISKEKKGLLLEKYNYLQSAQTIIEKMTQER